MTKTKAFESLKKHLVYELIDPTNTEQIEQASEQERIGFGTGIDPVELPEVIAYIAEHRGVWLQYALEDSKKNPTGVIELIKLEDALKYNPAEIQTKGDITESPFTVITGNHEHVFADARRFADDKYQIYDHGMAMSRQEQGYGTLLLKHALDETPGVRNKFISCYIDITTKESGELELAPNERSYTVHMKDGFRVVGVVDPPVYDDNITYLTFLRPSDSKPFRYKNNVRRIRFDGNPQGILDNTRDLLSKGFVGVSYDRQMHEMTFARLI